MACHVAGRALGAGREGMNPDPGAVARVLEEARAAVRQDRGYSFPEQMIPYLAGMVVGLCEEIDRLTSAGYVRRARHGVAPPKEHPPAIE